MKLTIALMCSCLFYQAFSQTEESSPKCQGSVLELVATSTQSHQSQLDELKSENNKLKAKMAKYDEQISMLNASARAGPQVAFTASVSTYTEAIQVLKYRSPIVNLGNALNPNTGEFTAPVSGTYWLSFKGISWKLGQVNVDLRVNQVITIRSATSTPDNFFTLAIGGVLILGAGDVVDIHLLNGQIYADGFCIFSGFIIQ